MSETTAEGRRRLPWCRVHESWYTTRSHAELGFTALNIGPRLMSLANGSPERGVLLGASGRPLTVEVLARETRGTAKAIREALAELVACGTLAVRADGAWWFPAFLRWQEDPSTERHRRRRSVNVTPVVTPTVTPDVTPPSRTEDRGQRTEDRSLPPGERETRAPACGERDWLALWDELAAGRGRIVGVLQLSGLERADLRAAGRSAAWWRSVLEHIERSPFLRGERRGFTVTPSWLLKVTNAERTLAGAYDEDPPAGTSTDAPRRRLTPAEAMLAESQRAVDALAARARASPLPNADHTLTLDAGAGPLEDRR